MYSLRKIALISPTGLLAGSGLSYLGGSWLAARSLSRRLVSARGLKPATARRENLLVGSRGAAPLVEDFRHAGSARHPVELAAIFASPGDPAARPTILFTHGKGGNAAEWQPDALRALARGYNVLLPELRGHAPSGGAFVTYGLLEKEDLANAVGLGPSALRHRPRPPRSALLLGRAPRSPSSSPRTPSGVQALWLESPFAEPAAMARHYLSRATGLPGPVLHLTSRWAVRRALDRIRRDLGPSEEKLELLDPASTLAQALGPRAPRLRREGPARAAPLRAPPRRGAAARAARSGARRPATATTTTRRRMCCRPSTSGDGGNSSAASPVEV